MDYRSPKPTATTTTTTAKQPFISWGGTVTRRLFAAVLLTSTLVPSATAAPFESAQIRRIIDGKEVFINRQPAKVNQQASNGQEVSTGLSRAELLFDRRALGFLGKNSLIQLGESCFRLQKGQVLINGPQNSCLGSKVLGVRGTTYVLTATDDNNYQLSVLAGEAVVSDQALPGDADGEANILKRYPRLNPVIGLTSSAWGSNAGGQAFGKGAGLVLGDLSLFLPLHQAEGSRLVYNYSSTSTNFDGFWGASTEVGYKWFDPNTRSVRTLMVGYDGWDSQTCFHSQLNAGGLWAKQGWELGVNGGLPLDGCDNNLSYLVGRVGIPIAETNSQTITLSISPYVLHAIGQSYGGGRLGLDVPINKQLSLSAYGQYDELMNTSIGGQIRYQFAPSGSFISDPNKEKKAEDTNLAETPDTNPCQVSEERGESITLKAGQEAVFNESGTLLSCAPMTQARYSQLIQQTMSGQNLLPESNVISDTYEDLYGKPDQQTGGILGKDWLDNAQKPYPREFGSDNSEVPDDKLPEEKKPDEDTKPTESSSDSSSNNPPQQFIFGGAAIAAPR